MVTLLILWTTQDTEDAWNGLLIGGTILGALVCGIYFAAAATPSVWAPLIGLAGFVFGGIAGVLYGLVDILVGAFIMDRIESRRRRARKG